VPAVARTSTPCLPAAARTLGRSLHSTGACLLYTQELHLIGSMYSCDFRSIMVHHTTIRLTASHAKIRQLAPGRRGRSGCWQRTLYITCFLMKSIAIICERSPSFEPRERVALQLSDAQALQRASDRLPPDRTSFLLKH
jgi:hypothetical protein